MKYVSFRCQLHEVEKRGTPEAMYWQRNDYILAEKSGGTFFRGTISSPVGSTIIFVFAGQGKAVDRDPNLTQTCNLETCS